MPNFLRRKVISITDFLGANFSATSKSGEINIMTHMAGPTDVLKTISTIITVTYVIY